MTRNKHGRDSSTMNKKKRKHIYEKKKQQSGFVIFTFKLKIYKKTAFAKIKSKNSSKVETWLIFFEDDVQKGQIHRNDVIDNDASTFKF